MNFNTGPAHIALKTAANTTYLFSNKIDNDVPPGTRRRLQVRQICSGESSRSYDQAFRRIGKFDFLF